MAIFKRLQADRIVKILRVTPVDGERHDAAQILALRVIFQQCGAAGFRLCQCVAVKRRAQMLAHHQRVKRARGLLEAANALLHRHAQAAFILPVDNAGAHNIAILRVAQIAFHRDFRWQPPLHRQNHARAVMHAQHAHNRLMRALKHTQHDDVLASDAFGKHHIPAERAFGIFPRTQQRSAVLRLHAVDAARHAAHLQAERLLPIPLITGRKCANKTRATRHLTPFPDGLCAAAPSVCAALCTGILRLLFGTGIPLLPATAFHPLTPALLSFTQRSIHTFIIAKKRG